MNTMNQLPEGKLVHDDQECPVYLWEREKPICIKLPLMAEVTPVEIHIKPDGDINDEPSLCFILETPVGVCVAAQMSLAKIWPAIEAAIKSKGPLT